MNYYSRNSPKKRKTNLPPGFLIPTPLNYSAQSTPRSKLKSHFNLTSRHSAQSQFDAYQKQQEILVLDDDVLYIPDNNQILIQEDQQFASQDHEEPSLASKSQGGVNSFKYIPPSQDSAHQLNIQKEQKFYQTEPLRKPENQQGLNSEGELKEDKYFFRNYSFGDKEFINNEQAPVQSKKQPLIRQLINMQALPKLENRTRRNRNKLEESQISHNSQNSKNLQYKSLKGRVEVEQGWSKIVKNFIKKRSYEKKSESNIEINSEEYQSQKYQKVQEEEMMPEEIGHFSTSSVGKQFTDELHRNGKKNTKEQSEIKIQDNEQDPPPPYFSEQPQIYVEQHNFVINHTSSTFEATTQMLDQIIKQLPEQLVPKYIALKNELQRKQYESEITINRMEETQRMLKMLIETHKKMIYADDYLLNEESEISDEMGEKIVINRQIIMSLVRKLALY